jgi:acetone carboxylase gamma subunit
MASNETGPTKDELGALIDGELDWSRTKQLVSGYKDPGRFDILLEVFEEQTEFDEEIVLPLSDKLFIVEGADGRPVRCRCGEELIDDYRKNWKMGALINVVGDDRLDELYIEEGQPDTRYCEIREFVCPSCGNHLEVETVPKGYPILQDFLPDVETFYEDWLGQSLDEYEPFEDRMVEVTNAWATEDG